MFQHLVKTYQGEPDKYVESYLWVKKCIEKGQVIYTPVIYKNPGGRRPGEEYVQLPIIYYCRFFVENHVTFPLDVLNSPMKTRITYATGSQRRYPTRRPEGGLETDYISNYVKW